MSWWRPWRRPKKVEWLAVEATEQVATVTKLYTALVDRYLQLLDENLKLKIQLAQERAITCSVQEGLIQKYLN